MYVREGGSHWVRGFTGALVIVVAVLGFVVWSPVRTPVTEFGFHASLVDQGPPPALLPGSTTTYSMHFRNVGLVAWQRGTDKQVTLGVNGDALTYADAGMAVDWLSPARIVSTSEELVLPGTIGTFSFKMRAPATPGTYKVPVRLVVEGLAWLDHDPITVEITSDLGFHSRLVDQSAHVILKPGEMSGPLTLHVRNTGAKTWTRGVTGQQANLGLSGDDKALSILGVGWPSADRVAVQTEPSVGPGGIATFTFRVRAPFAPGTYALRLRPVVDGLTWLEDEGIVTLVTVLGPAGATPTPVLGEAFKNVQPINFAFDATADPREVGERQRLRRRVEGALRRKGARRHVLGRLAGRDSAVTPADRNGGAERPELHRGAAPLGSAEPDRISRANRGADGLAGVHPGTGADLLVDYVVQRDERLRGWIGRPDQRGDQRDRDDRARRH